VVEHEDLYATCGRARLPLTFSQSIRALVMVEREDLQQNSVELSISA